MINIPLQKPLKFTLIKRINIKSIYTDDKHSIKEFNKHEREIYKKRITIENFFANYKQPTKLNMRYEKYFRNMMGFINIYMSRLLL